MTKNVLFIMCDQLRWDYLSCAGHPGIRTPHIDALAKRGVRFDRAYVQSTICGPSRMSTYTGRYVHSHGASWNGIPLKVGEMTMGDHLRKAGMGCHLIGKTHMVADAEGMQRLGLAPDSVIGVRQSECGFDPWVRDDGLWAEGPDGFYDSKRSPYNEYLKDKGYPGENPWNDFANAGIEGDDIASGWFMVNADKPANIAEEDSETPWLTTQAMEFIEQAEGPWCAHLSYIKPHWPYIVPAPYHDMYGAEHVLPVVRSDAEREDAHPVFNGMMNNQIGKTFSRDEVRTKVIPAYMGLIKQLDDNLGRLFAWMQAQGLAENTIIAFTSDHGDYMGDHWMGDKDFYHEMAVKVPLIIADPRPEADATRGQASDALVEMIDLAPTFMAALGAGAKPHIIEGRDLTPILHGQDGFSRRYVISEHDYHWSEMARALGQPQEDAHTKMIFDGRWKYIRCEGFRPVMFDLATDPDELTDIGASDLPEHQQVRARMEAALLQWATRHHTRITATPAVLARQKIAAETGILIGFWDEDEYEQTVGKPFSALVPHGRP